MRPDPMTCYECETCGEAWSGDRIPLNGEGDPEGFAFDDWLLVRCPACGEDPTILDAESE